MPPPDFLLNDSFSERDWGHDVSLLYNIYWSYFTKRNNILFWSVFIWNPRPVAEAKILLRFPLSWYNCFRFYIDFLWICGCFTVILYFGLLLPLHQVVGKLAATLVHSLCTIVLFWVSAPFWPDFVEIHWDMWRLYLIYRLGGICPVTW